MTDPKELNRILIQTVTSSNRGANYSTAPQPKPAGARLRTLAAGCRDLASDTIRSLVLSWDATQWQHPRGRRHIFGAWRWRDAGRGPCRKDFLSAKQAGATVIESRGFAKRLMMWQNVGDQ